jgi:hypothetical protein
MANMLDKHKTSTAERVAWLAAIIALGSIVVCVVLTLIGPSLGAPKHTPRTHPGLQAQATIDQLLLNPVAATSPVWLSDAPGTTLTNSEMACITLFQSYFWEQGMKDDALQSHLSRNTSLFVDDQHFSTPYTQVDGIPSDETGKPTDKWNAPLEWCFIIDLDSGAHLFRLETKGVSEQKFSYSGVWFVKGD